MSQTKLPKWAIVGLAALVLLGIGSAVYNSGWSQGFLMGLLTGNVTGSGEITPYLVSRTHGWHPGGFGFFGAIFRVFFFVLLLGLFFKFLGFCRWRMHGWQGGPGGYGPGWHGWQREPHHGPWQQPPQQPQQPTQPGNEPAQESKTQPTSWTQV